MLQRVIDDSMRLQQPVSGREKLRSVRRRDMHIGHDRCSKIQLRIDNGTDSVEGDTQLYVPRLANEDKGYKSIL